jgi:hypothetical protein
MTDIHSNFTLPSAPAMPASSTPEFPVLRPQDPENQITTPPDSDVPEYSLPVSGVPVSSVPVVSTGTDKRRKPNKLMVDDATNDDNSVIGLSVKAMEELNLFRGDTCLIKVCMYVYVYVYVYVCVW